MNREVIISITGSENSPNGKEENLVELVTEGKYYKKGDKYYVSYKETSVTGFDDNTTTTLKIDGKTVAMTRFGQVNTHMVFKQGEKHTGYYETPYGSFTVGVLSDDVDVNINDGGGEIHINYLLQIDNATRARHDLKLNIREA